MQHKVTAVQNNGSLIILTSSTGDFVAIQKLDFKLKYTPDNLFAYDTKLSGNAPIQVEDDCYVINFANVTTPLEANNLDLANTIKSYLNS